ncbi:MAG: sensor histidine kinase [Bdellovibrionales bacterium]
MGAEICSNYKFVSEAKIYQFVIPSQVCKLKSDCWFSYNAPIEKFEISQDFRKIFSYSNSDSYAAHQVLIGKIESFSKVTTIKIKSLQGYGIKKEPENLCIYISDYKTARINQLLNWFFRSGGTLMSAYFLIIISLFLALILMITKIKILFELLAYSLISAIYLISFSEYPREFISPLNLSGPIHFPLRLLQDLLLVRVFGALQEKEILKSLTNRLTFLYLVAIAIFPFLFLIGANTYEYYERSIFLVAPLVAAPMAVGSWFALQLKSKFERNILIPSCLILFGFQLNDLLVFWGIYPGFFMVKFYIPFIVGLILFVIIRRIYVSSLNVKLDEQKSKLMGNILHDIQSPLVAIRNSILYSHEFEPVSKDIIMSSVLRIEDMVTNLNDSSFHTKANFTIPVSVHLKNIINEKKLNHKNYNFIFRYKEELFINCNPFLLERVFCNLLNNSINACSKNLNNENIVIITMHKVDNLLEVRIRDNGVGLPQNFDKLNFKRGFTTNFNGNGIGLSSSQDYIKSIGGKIFFSDCFEIGADLRIHLPLELKTPNFILQKINFDEFERNIVFEPHNIKLDLNKNILYDLSNIKNFKDFVRKLNNAASIAGVQLYITGSNFQYTCIINLFSNEPIFFNWVIKLEELAFEPADCILIDDDELIRRTWMLSAKKNGKKIFTYPSIRDFLFSSRYYNTNTPIFCDLTFGNKVENRVIDILMGEGFKDVRLCTGLSPESVKTYSNIIKNHSKSPPNFENLN